MKKVASRKEETKEKRVGSESWYSGCEPLMTLVLQAGLRALAEQLEADRQKLCGPKSKRQSERRCYRAGYCPSEIALLGRKVRVTKPRVCDLSGCEVPLPSWHELRERSGLDARAVEQMLLGVSCRKYARSLPVLGEQVPTRGARKSAVSRRFVEKTEQYVRSFLHRDLTEVKLCALLVDGLHVADHVILVAMGVDLEGHKHVLGLAEGATENAASCRQLLTGLHDRGLRFEHSFIAVLDGSKALRKAMREVFGTYALIQRCQEHKKRNVTDQLPRAMQDEVRARMHAAYCSKRFDSAQAQLLSLLRLLENNHPGAAASLREGLDETLTLKRLGLPLSLERALSTTNMIENLMGSIRNTTARVKHWKNASMILRWVAMALIEAEPGLRPLPSRAYIPQLLNSLASLRSTRQPHLDEVAA